MNNGTVIKILLLLCLTIILTGLVGQLLTDSIIMSKLAMASLWMLYGIIGATAYVQPREKMIGRLGLSVLIIALFGPLAFVVAIDDVQRGRR